MQSLIETTRLGSAVWIVSLVGQHDVSTADAVRRRLEAASQTDTGTVLDLCEASLVDTSIIQVILDQPWNRLALVVPPDGPICRLIDRLMLRDAVPTYASRLVACREMAPLHRMLTTPETTPASPHPGQNANAGTRPF